MARVRVYSTPTCIYCQALKEFLSQHNIEFEDIDVSQDEEKAKEMVEKSGQMGVPVIIIETDNGEEKIIVGFQKEEIARILGIED